MAISQNNTIIYKDLVDNVVNKIVSMCSNVGSVPQDIPLDIIPGSTYEDKGLIGKRCVQISLKDPDRLITSGTGSGINVVQKQTIKTQLTDFLSQRGISQNPGVVISSKGIINFFNNVAIFINARIISITSIKDKNKLYHFYISKSNVTVKSSVFDFNDSNTPTALSDNEIRSSLSNINDCLSNKNKSTYVDLRLVCSSCSSSSSSSCSSSSSSSYIVYMLI